MSKVGKIEGAIRTLSAKELAALRAWFLEFDAEAWDRQIEEDARSGKLAALAAQALRDHRAGKSSPL